MFCQIMPYNFKEVEDENENYNSEARSQSARSQEAEIYSQKCWHLFRWMV